MSGRLHWCDNGARDKGTIDDLPWAPVFDPAANARALSASRAEGLLGGE